MIPTATHHFDVLIVGAGISGIGMARQLKTERPHTTFAVLDAKPEIGGTWTQFRYPGIRSDADMATFGYSFKPWTHRKVLGDAAVILKYLREVVDENDLAAHFRFGRRVSVADFDTATGLWTVTTRDAVTGAEERYTARFLFSGTGYYDHDKGYTPEFAGVDGFGGQVVHPQDWPEDLVYAGKRVVVIGSGATAVTLAPAMAGTAGHVTMLQRSPSYVVAFPAEDPIANTLNRVIGPDRAHALIRRKNIARYDVVYKLSRRFPRLMRRALIAGVRRRLPKTFDVDTHFAPTYDPWDQRLCMVPDGDLFKAIGSGDASVVTDRIERFTPTGIQLESGQHLDADIVITATGLNMLPLGGIGLRVDRRPVDLPSTTVYKSMMLSGVPNFAFAVGYTNIPWTLKVDLVSEHVCRLLDHMDTHGHATVEPVLDDGVQPVPLIDLAAGYVQRGLAQFPKAGTTGPWTVAQDYDFDVDRLRRAPIEDPALRFTSAPTIAVTPSPHALTA